MAVEDRFLLRRSLVEAAASGWRALQCATREFAAVIRSSLTIW